MPKKFPRNTLRGVSCRRAVSRGVVFVSSPAPAAKISAEAAGTQLVPGRPTTTRGPRSRARTACDLPLLHSPPGAHRPGRVAAAQLQSFSEPSFNKPAHSAQPPARRPPPAG